MDDTDKQMVNIRLNRKLWHKVRVEAAINGKTITEWITELLEAKVGKG